MNNNNTTTALLKKTLKFLQRVLVVIIPFLLLSCDNRNNLSDQGKLEKINSMYQEYKESFSDVPDITVRELLQMMSDSNIILVDTREKAECSVSMIPEAVSTEQFEQDITKHKNKTVITYCTIGLRSGQYAERLQKQGLKAYNLKGGILAWAHDGRKFINANKETTRAHVYGPKWNLLPKDYESVW